MTENEIIKKAKAEYARRWRSEHAEQCREYARRWRAEHPDKKAEYQKKFWCKKAVEMGIAEAIE